MMESTSTFRLLSSTLLKRLTVNTRLIKEVEIFNCSYILHLIRVWFIPQSSSSLPSTQSSWPLHTPRMSVHDLSRMHVNSPISHAVTTTTTDIAFYTLFVVVLLQKYMYNPGTLPWGLVEGGSKICVCLPPPPPKKQQLLTAQMAFSSCAVILRYA